MNSDMMLTVNQTATNYKLINAICKEQLGGEFELVILVDTGRAENTQAWRQKEVLLSVNYREFTRDFMGYVCDSSVIIEHAGWVEVAIVPYFKLLDDQPRSRCFVDTSVVAIIQKIANHHWRLKISHAFLNKRYKPLHYVVQYQETDYVFLKRLMSENGIAYRFADDVMVLFDDIAGYQSVDVADTHIQLWRRQTAFIPERIQCLGPYTVSLSSTPNRYDLCQHYLAYNSTQFNADQSAQFHLNRLKQSQHPIQASSDALCLSVGAQFSYGRSFVINEIYHFFNVDQGALVYSNQFYCVDAALTLSLPYYARPCTKTALKGTVRSIEKSDLLRARIQFPWDQNKALSPYLSVRQYWCGDHLGAQFMPHIGDEVWVDFRSGDLSEPIILGPTWRVANYFQVGAPTSYIRLQKKDILFNTQGVYSVVSHSEVALISRDTLQIETKKKRDNAMIAQQQMTLSSYRLISFQVGSSMLTLDGGELTITADKITINRS
ncbi:MAG: hypothetical protein COB66_06715 [Coxiella sp. (in: Bacteria)]|nr:MAG: hypothetical protein COB66_06715 [Coxiella sp. (in: g-proteobacteria)]